MKLFIINMIFVLLATQNQFSQWINQNPVPEGNDLWSTFFIDDITGWIVGSEGFIKKTTNGGIDWSQQNSGTSLILKSVQFVDQSTGWICGESGLILKTTDSGLKWFPLTSGTNEHLTDIEFLDINTGYLVGFNGTIKKTTDGGSTWMTQASGSSVNIHNVNFIDTDIGFAVGGEYGSYTAIKTTDGGINWFNIYNGINIDYYSCLLVVDFIDVKTGFIGGGGNWDDFIYKTTDGGETWVRLNSFLHLNNKEQNCKENLGIYYSGGINSIYFKDSKIGYAVGGNGNGWNRQIYTTTDSGSTWTQKYIGWEENGLTSVYGNSQGQGWAIGFTGAIFITEDTGNSWVQILSGDKSSNFSGDDIYSVFSLDENILWAVGKRDRWLPSAGHIILKTTNGGKTWKTQRFFQGTGGLLRIIYFLNEYIGWAVGQGTTGLYRTTDGGENWIEENSSYSSIFFVDQYNGWATKDDYNNGIYKSTDGGITWTQKSSISSSSVYFSDINTGWAVGESGSILKSTNSGETWSMLISGSSIDLNYVRFYNQDLGMCVGNSGTILLSTDGGESWIHQISGTVNDLNSITFTNSNSIWIAGANGTILSTSDLGTNWNLHEGVTVNNLSSICFINEDTGWIGGMSGTMFKYQNDVVPVELVSLTATLNNNTVELNWKTETEVNNSGFEIQRQVGSWQSAASNWKSIGFVPGFGTTTEPKSYFFADEDLTIGNYLYRLKQIDFDGSFYYSNEIEVEIVPNKFTLYQNYPNPFNPSTTIEFSLPEDVNNVILSIYNLLGEKVAELANTSLAAGNYKYDWNAKSVPSGMYIYELRTDNFDLVKKMVLLR